MGLGYSIYKNIKAMKKLLVVLSFSFMFTSCAKSVLNPAQNKTVIQRWIVQEGHDRMTWDHAFFCDSTAYGKIDTIHLSFNKEPNDSTKFSDQVGSIVYHEPGGHIPTDDPDIFDRYYCKLLKQIE